MTGKTKIYTDNGKKLVTTLPFILPNISIGTTFQLPGFHLMVFSTIWFGYTVFENDEVWLEIIVE